MPFKMSVKFAANGFRLGDIGAFKYKFSKSAPISQNRFKAYQGFLIKSGRAAKYLCHLNFR